MDFQLWSHVRSIIMVLLDNILDTIIYLNEIIILKNGHYSDVGTLLLNVDPGDNILAVHIFQYTYYNIWIEVISDGMISYKTFIEGFIHWRLQGGHGNHARTRPDNLCNIMVFEL